VISSREEKLDYSWVRGLWLLVYACLVQNDCEDTADNIGDDNAS